MQDRPTAPELLDAVREFIATELLPTVGDARLRFRTLVAANLLDMLHRELALEPALLRAEGGRLGQLLGDADAPVQDLAELAPALKAKNAALCALIRAGQTPNDTLAVVTEAVQGKLEVANPRYLADFVAI